MMGKKSRNNTKTNNTTNVVETPEYKGWKIGAQNITENITNAQVRFICKLENMQYFGYVPKSIDTKTNKWTNILKIGCAQRAHGASGVKYIYDNKKGELALFELKDGGAGRLYATKAYQNHDGQRLVIFDQEDTNHKQVQKKINNKQELQIKICPNAENAPDAPIKMWDDSYMDPQWDTPYENTQSSIVIGEVTCICDPI